MHLLNLYFIFWLSLGLVALLLIIIERKNLGIFSVNYWQFLTLKWKVFTFLISIGILNGCVSFMHDATWDYIDSTFMGILTYFTAPWSIGAIFSAVFRGRNLKHFLIAVWFWLFSSSWSYDLYNYWIHGFYPPSWWSNLLLSGLLYLAAGIFWNLDYYEGTEIRIAFTLKDWPRKGVPLPFWKLLIMALPFVAVYFYVVFGLVL